MSRDFIGSKISIITKSQCRYIGTIIGIDAQTSSIVLANVKCIGTENRSGHLTNGHVVGATSAIMQFANSDIEDLKIVDEEQAPETPKQKSYPMPPVSSPPSSQQPSIHDDPAIVSAVVSSSNKDNTSTSSISNRLIHNLQHMTLSDEHSKNEESRIRSNSGELGASWSLLSSSKWDQRNNNNNNPKASFQHQSGNKSKFFDDFISDKNNNNTNQFQSDRSHQRSSNTHSTQTSRENGGGQYDDNGLRIRQPFFSNDRPYPQRQQEQEELQPQQQQQQNRYQNGNAQQQQRYFYNNRRPQMPNQQRRIGGGVGNRETFQDNPNDYDADFDFETSNLKFNKLTNEDESKNSTDLPTRQSFQPQTDIDSSAEYPPIYDKKKSFFDNIAITEPSDAPTSYMYNRSKNTDTFGNDGYQRQNNRSNGNGYRRSNNNYQQQQYGNNDFNYRQQQHGSKDFNYRQQQYGNNDFNYRQQQHGNNDFNYRQHNNNNNNNNGYQYRY